MTEEFLYDKIHGNQKDYGEYSKITGDYIEFDLKTIPSGQRLISKIHISINTERNNAADSKTVEQAWNSIIQILVNNKVPAFKVINRDSAHLVQDGKSIVLYHDGNFGAWAKVLQNIEQALLKARIKPGAPPHYRFGQEFSDTPLEAAIIGSQFFYHEIECLSHKEYLKSMSSNGLTTDGIRRARLGSFHSIHINNTEELEQRLSKLSKENTAASTKETIGLELQALRLHVKVASRANAEIIKLRAENDEEEKEAQAIITAIRTNIEEAKKKSAIAIEENNTAKEQLINAAQLVRRTETTPKSQTEAVKIAEQKKDEAEQVIRLALARQGRLAYLARTLMEQGKAEQELQNAKQELQNAKQELQNAKQELQNAKQALEAAKVAQKQAEDALYRATQQHNTAKTNHKNTSANLNKTQNDLNALKTIENKSPSKEHTETILEKVNRKLEKKSSQKDISSKAEISISKKINDLLSPDQDTVSQESVTDLQAKAQDKSTHAERELQNAKQAITEQKKIDLNTQALNLYKEAELSAKAATTQAIVKYTQERTKEAWKEICDTTRKLRDIKQAITVSQEIVASLQTKVPKVSTQATIEQEAIVNPKDQPVAPPPNEASRNQEATKEPLFGAQAQTTIMPKSKDKPTAATPKTAASREIVNKKEKRANTKYAEHGALTARLDQFSTPGEPVQSHSNSSSSGQMAAAGLTSGELHAVAIGRGKASVQFNPASSELTQLSERLRVLGDMPSATFQTRQSEETTPSLRAAGLPSQALDAAAKRSSKATGQFSPNRPVIVQPQSSELIGAQIPRVPKKS